MPDKRLKQLFAFLSFAISFVVYMMTVAPTVSFWDCGEFIASAYTQAVPHPPGSPLYLLVARIFTMIPAGIIEDIALRVNIISVLTSSFAVLFLYLVIVRFLDWMNGPRVESEDHFIEYFGAFIGSMVFAFSYSFWFNAVEAEVYAPSMFFTAIIVWLIMKWADQHDKPGNERYLILIAYLNGLAIGVHLLNILALPFIVYIVYFKKYEFNSKTFWKATGAGMAITGFIYIFLVKKILLIPAEFGFLKFLIFFLVLLVAIQQTIKHRFKIVSLALISSMLIIVGYSTYGYIYIRSGLNPTIDENNPETIEKFISYMEREQYGVSQGFTKDYMERKAPFIEYQVNKMYFRYFFWQFLGRNDRTDQVDTYKFLMLPLLLGLFGAFRHYKKNPQFAFTNFVLWFMTGLAIILYLNQPDPQPRERDYSYVGSFFAFAVWVGIGAAELIRLLKEKKFLKTPIMVQGAAMALLVVPGIMLVTNYKAQDRSGNYVAWDYSYNMLAGLEPNAIIYTNGDNDTFPLWYLQEVENIRKDVKIANLSLLNTDWYVKQLRDLEPKIPIKLSDRQIDRLGPVRWTENHQKQFFTVPDNVLQESLALYNKEFPDRPVLKPSRRISFNVPPNFGPAIKMADLMMLHLFETTKLTQPIYYAATVSPDNMLGSLRSYMRMDGTVLKVTPIKDWHISPTNIHENLKNVFKFRNLDNPDVYYNNSTRALLQNYRAAFLQLLDYYVRKGDSENARDVVRLLNEKIPDDIIPYTNSKLKRLFRLFAIAAGIGSDEMDFIDPTLTRDIEYFGNSFLQNGPYETAINCFHYLVQDQPANLQYVKNYVRALNLAGEKEISMQFLQETKQQASGSEVGIWAEKELARINITSAN